MLNLEIKLYHALVLIWFAFPFLNLLLFVIFSLWSGEFQWLKITMPIWIGCFVF